MAYIINYFLALSSFILCSIATYAQNEETNSEQSISSVNLENNPNQSAKSFVDTRISILMETYDSETLVNPTIQGYRIELFSSSGENSRAKATQLKDAFLKTHPDKSAYVVWEYPNFEFHIGNYRTKLEAEHDLSIIIEEFPFAFVTKSQIELPELNNADSKKAE